MSEDLKNVNDQDFEQEVLQSDKPVLVDFWAEWCSPCLKLTPIIETIAQKFANEAKVVKLNVEDANQIAVRFGVKGIPTLILFKGGSEFERVSGGNASKESISGMIERALG